jgi:hypothetical protein
MPLSVTHSVALSLTTSPSSSYHFEDLAKDDEGCAAIFAQGGQASSCTCPFARIKALAERTLKEGTIMALFGKCHSLVQIGHHSHLQMPVHGYTDRVCATTRC